MIGKAFFLTMFNVILFYYLCWCLFLMTGSVYPSFAVVPFFVFNAAQIVPWVFD